MFTIDVWDAIEVEIREHRWSRRRKRRLVVVAVKLKNGETFGLRCWADSPLPLIEHVIIDPKR